MLLLGFFQRLHRSLQILSFEPFQRLIQFHKSFLVLNFAENILSGRCCLVIAVFNLGTSAGLGQSFRDHWTTHQAGWHGVSSYIIGICFGNCRSKRFLTCRVVWHRIRRRTENRHGQWFLIGSQGRGVRRKRRLRFSIETYFENEPPTDTQSGQQQHGPCQPKTGQRSDQQGSPTGFLPQRKILRNV